MISNSLSVNKNVLKIINKMIEKKDELKINVEKTTENTTIIDAGIEVQGGYQAGKYITEACMGGFGKANLSLMNFDDINLPTITVSTDLPEIALFGSQFAGWKISVGKYFAMGSGPARALALKPKNLYIKINYQDKADIATIVLETSKKPPENVLQHIAKECNVKPEKLNVIVTPTSSLAGSTQISGRIIETGLHKLAEIGLDPKTVISSIGYAPIAPIHPKTSDAMGRTNDMILYGGVAFFNVFYNDDDKLRDIVVKTPSSASKDYGKPFIEIFKEAGYDFYKIDNALFAPAKVIVNNLKTGKCFKAGRINMRIIKKSLNL